MSLLRDIQRDAADEAVPVASLLRKCLILAGRLRAEELRAWVQSELGGYAVDSPLPPYRGRIRGQLIGNVSNLAWRHSDATLSELMIPEELRDTFLDLDLRHPVAELQELAAAGNDPSRSLPPELTNLMSQHLEGGYHVTSARVVFSRPALLAVLDGIRTRALEFALEIEALNPQAGESSGTDAPLSEAAINGAFSNTIYAQNVNVAQGSPGTTQGMVVVQAGDWASLARALLDAGVTSDELDQLRFAIESDSTEQASDGLGHSVAEWLGRVTGRIARVAGTVATGAAAQFIGQALASYYGLS